MSNGINRVRKSINQRKKLRGLHSKDTKAKQLIPRFPQEEEKHGYYPMFSESDFSSERMNSRISGFILKGMLSVMLFFGVALLFQVDSELLTEPKNWTSNALTEEFPFASVNQWYQDTFGAPLALTPGDKDTKGDSQPLVLPVSGSVSQSFQANGTGIMIAPDEASEVSALREGAVIFAGNDPETGKTVIVQHTDDSKTIYGNLSSIDVHLYQFVDRNQKLGGFVPAAENETVYFAIEKDDTYIDPVQVIKVDETP
ncbi:peptidoglycan DD-metalloendopeptidase family protein [Virgibacillus kekensis]|uniref:Peptidoglycan DD-metalloendopeptidase family protein n=1 Tax=Virgibacillus kekensis TaxID=202261 RepID=A0ABV9DKK6_9BACI